MLKTRLQIIKKVSLNTIIGNIFLSILKFLAGIFAHSTALISDAIHSLSDVLSTIIVIIGSKMADKKADKEHPFGHERMESVASLILSVILLFTGIFIAYNGLEIIISQKYKELELPGLIALIAAIVSIIVKELMYWYTHYYAKKISSSALEADAWHHRSDALSSIGSFIGILLARLFNPLLDPLASIVISLFIIKASCSIFHQAILSMVDHACEEELLNKIIAFIKKEEFVLEVRQVKTRLFGNKIYLEIEVVYDKKLSLEKVYQLNQELHDLLEENFQEIKHCVIIPLPN